jgi:hypothetical protein
MAQNTSQASTPVDNESKSPDELRRDIEGTREELGDTAAALAAKSDVKTRARRKVADVKQTVTEKKRTLAENTSGGGAEGGDAQARATSAVTDLKTKADQNPTAAAAIAAFFGGYVIGRLRSR